jgi:hypothetical protein
MDSVAAPGVSALYSRGDHVHPSDTARVAKAGDTMSGQLNQIAVSPAISMYSSGAAGGGVLYGGTHSNLPRWGLYLGDGSPETGGDAGSNFGIYAYNDAGAQKASYLTINRASGGITCAGSGGASFYGPVVAGGGGVAGSYYFGSSGTKYLNYDGTNFNLVGGGIVMNTPDCVVVGNVWSRTSATAGMYQFGNSGTKYLQYDGTNFNLTGGSFVINAGAYVSGIVQSQLSATTGFYYFGNTGTKYLSYDGTNFNLAGGSFIAPALVATGNATIGYGGTAGVLAFGNTGTKYLQYDGINFNLVGGALDVAGVIGIANTAGMINVGYSGAACGATWRPSADPAYPHIFYNSGAGQVGNINTTVSATNYTTASDIRLKEDLQAFDAGNIIDGTEVYSFRWKSTGERSYGVSAQQANEIYPQAVSHNEQEDFWGVDYSKYVPVLLQELKALRARVAQLEGAAGTRPA